MNIGHTRLFLTKPLEAMDQESGVIRRLLLIALLLDLHTL